MPVVTLWLFALGGLGIAAPAGRESVSLERGPLTRIVAAIGILLLALTPALIAISQRELDAAVAAFRRGDCPATARAALSSAASVNVRPQPFELLAYCDVRAGLPRLSEKMMREALARDRRVRVASGNSAVALQKRLSLGQNVSDAVTLYVEGVVQREAGRVRVDARMVNAADGFMVWAQSYEGDANQLLALRAEIGAAVSEAVRSQLGLSEPTTQPATTKQN